MPEIQNHDGVDRRTMLQVATASVVLPVCHEISVPAADVFSVRTITPIIEQQKATAAFITFDAELLKGHYDEWVFNKNKPGEKICGIDAVDFNEGVMRQAGLLKPGEVMTHALWKRCIEQQKVADASKKLEWLQCDSVKNHIRSLSRLEIEDLMHQPFELYEKEPK